MTHNWFATSLGGLALAGMALVAVPNTAEAQRIRPYGSFGRGSVGYGTYPSGYGYSPSNYGWGSNYYPGMSFGNSNLRFGTGSAYSGYGGDFYSPRYSNYYGSNWGYGPNQGYGPNWGYSSNWGGGSYGPRAMYGSNWNYSPSASTWNYPSTGYTYSTPQSQYRSFYPSTGMSPYSQPMTTGSYSTTGTSVQQPANTQLINVTVPANAEVMFNGAATSQKGTSRQFVTPPLTPGSNYTYEVTAKWMKDGQEVTRTRMLNFEAGTQNQLNVDFTQDVAQ